MSTNLNSVGNYAFQACGLTEAMLPDSVGSIGQGAFAQSALASINFPSGVSSIEYAVFWQCGSLHNITIPEGVTSIDSQAFWSSGLTNVTFPDTLTSIGYKAFGSCNLTVVFIPTKVTSIGPLAFDQCPNLRGITVDPSSRFYSSVDGVLFDKAQTTLVQYPQGRAGGWSLPSTITQIADYACYACTGLSSLELPDSLTNIGAWSFYGCPLTSVIGGRGLICLGNCAFYGCDRLTGFPIGDHVSQIGYEAFGFCHSLRSVVLPDSLTSLGSYAFNGCNNLTNVVFGNGVTNIGTYAFSGTGLRSVTLPASLTSVAQGTFDGCFSLVSVTIPSTVTNLDSAAFMSCSGLAAVYFEGKAPGVAANTFSGANIATVYYLPGTVGWGPTFGGRPTATWLQPLLAPSYRILHNFSGPDGASPMSLIVSGTTLYGTTTDGGSSSNGVVFSLNVDGSGYSLVKDFAGGSDGAWPWGQLVLSGTTLYGTGVNGGNNDNGLVFKVGTDGTGYTILKRFNGTDGSSPFAGLALCGTALYGTTSEGGSQDHGTLFTLNTDGSGFRVLKEFFTGAEPWPAWPYGGLVVSNGTLFGTTTQGGTAGYGSVFKINADGSGYTLLKSFMNTDGEAPVATLVLSGRALFGTTRQGGANGGYGAVFKVNIDGTGFATLKNFYDQGSDGYSPRCSLILSGTNLYGMTAASLGGSGTVFQIETDGSGFTVLKRFDGSDGGFPYSSLALCGTTLYGTTFSGGSSNRGVVFALGYPSGIRRSPQSQTAEVGATVCFSAEVTNSPVQFQWLFNGTNVINDATNVCLNLTSVQVAQAGTYALVATNVFGSVTSTPAALSVIQAVPRRMVPAFTLNGDPGNSLNVEYSDELGFAANWFPLSTLVLTNPPQFCFDVSMPVPPQRFYRAWQSGTLMILPSLNPPSMVPAITLTGNIGNSIRVDYINQFGPTDAWVTLDTVTLTNTSQLYFDTSCIGQPRRLYRLVPVP